MYAYILMNLVEKGEQGILEDLQALPEVVEAHILFGEWDLILKVKLPAVENAAEFVMKKLRSNEGVKLTSTLIVAK